MSDADVPDCTSATCDTLVPADRPVDLPGEEGATTEDPCDLTNIQVTHVFATYCAMCHTDPGDPQAPFHNIMTWDGMEGLMQGTSSQVKDPPITGSPVRLIVPGNPEKSRLYQRMALTRDMPKPQDPSVANPLPRPTISDYSLVRTWIKDCVGPAEPDPGSGGSSSGTGGTAGTPAAGGGGTGGA